MYQLVRIAQLIGLNALPGFGFLALHWTGGTILALYWIENLVGSLLVAARIDLHRRLTHKRGHYTSRDIKAVTVTIDGHPKKLKTLLASFLVTSIVFTLAEGIFLLLILSKLPAADAVDFDSLRFGVRAVTALLAAGFLLDLIGIRDRPFFWIHRIANAMLSRVLVLFFVVFIGVGALVFFDAPRPALLVFIALKTLIDIASELPESQTGEAPQWQLAIAGLFGPQKKAKFAAYARDANREYGTYSPEDEQQMGVA
jgi:hypothetical protein